ncbi:MAG: hypothetical protein JWN04_1863 [Myxococcaceae bacterium]|nr:hypothetical protein [Myxococcaceae bacterium]
MTQRVIKIYDCTLREGAQASGISFSVQDKLRITRLVDEMGFTYTEGGWPSSNVKDELYFQQVKALRLNHTKVVAFGRTKSRRTRADEDPSLTALVRTGLECGHIFGKGWDLHVRSVLRLTPDENLEVIYESISYLKKHISEVSFGFEHFFDAYKSNPAYTMKVIATAIEAGVDWIDLADTNGGSFPDEVSAAVSRVTNRFDIDFAVHCHDDTGCAVANTIAAVRSGVTIVEGTINGYSERCGIADLCTVIPNLQLKLGYSCIPEENMKQLTRLSSEVADILQADVLKYHPYVGLFAFTHKAGVHVDAFMKDPQTYEHIEPTLVGNSSNVALSEVSGRANLRFFLRKHQLERHFAESELQELVALVKELELNGFEFNTSEESLLLVLLKRLGKYRQRIRVVRQSITISAHVAGSLGGSSEPEFAIRELNADSVPESDTDTQCIALDADFEFMTSEGRRREHLHVALAGEQACFSTLVSRLIGSVVSIFPELHGTSLVEYKMRAVQTPNDQKQQVRVVIELTDGRRDWKMTALGKTLASAVILATVDALEYRMHMDRLTAETQGSLRAS